MYTVKKILLTFAGVMSIATISHATTLSKDIDVTPAQKPIYDFSVPASNFKVTAWTDRRDARYHAGENVSLYIRSNRDAYITVLDVGTSGKVHVVFPNKYQRDNHVLAHQVVEIPAPDASFNFRVSGPAGVEVLKIIATNTNTSLFQQSRLADAGVYSRVTGSTERITKDLEVKLKPFYDNSDAGIPPAPPTTDQYAGLRPHSDRHADTRPRLRHNTTYQSGASTFTLPLRILQRRSDASRHGGAMRAEPVANELFNRGEAFFHGQGKRIDYHRASALFRRAAEKGHVLAMLRIGQIFERGMEVDADPALAMRWYDKAARLGNAQAMVALARLYGRGKGVPQNNRLAVAWLKKAASAGNGIAMVNLSKMYDAGIKVKADETKAARYLLAAARAGAWIIQENLVHYSLPARLAVQRTLKKQGYYKGQLDGSIGAETRAAIVDYARAG